MVGPARVGEEGVDQPLAAVGASVGEEGLDLGRGRDDPADVERHPADEVGVGDEAGRRDLGGEETGVDEAVDVAMDRGGVGRRRRGNLRGHDGRPRGEPLLGLGMPPGPKIGLPSHGGLAAGGVFSIQVSPQPIREFLPARVGERHGLAGGRRDQGHCVGRADAHREVARLRPAIPAPHPHLHPHEMPLAVADDVYDRLLVALRHGADAGRPGPVGHKDLFVAVALVARRRERRDGLAVEKHASAAAGADREQLGARRQFDAAAGPHNERIRAVLANARLAVAEWQVNERELRPRERFGGAGTADIPAAIGHSLEDLVEHRGLGEVGRLRAPLDRHRLVHVPAAANLRGRHGAAVDRHLVEQAEERRARIAVDRRADPDLVVIYHRRLRGRAAKVPRAAHGPAIDVAADRVRLAEGVADGDVVPAAARLEALGGDPAVEVFGSPLAVVGVAKQEARPGKAIGGRDPQRPVLVVGRDAGIARAALADDVDLLAVLELERIHPGFERDRVAGDKVEGRVSTGIGDTEKAPAAAEHGRLVVGGEAPLPWRPRAGLAKDHAGAVDLSTVSLELVGRLEGEPGHRHEPGGRAGRLCGRHRPADAGDEQGDEPP